MASSEVILLSGDATRKVDVTIASGESRQQVFVALPGDGGVIDCSVSVRFSGEGGECTLRGLYLAGGRSSVNFTVNMEHGVPNCSSRQLFKGIVAGEARTRFFGLIRVPEKCIGTEAYQENHNLLLSDDCRSQSLPQLEIYADDVKCSHGSTVGQLNEAALFYMRQRGIPEDEARLLLKFAFMGQVIDGIPMTSLRDRLHYLVEKRFRGELGKCGGCQNALNCER